MLTKVQELKLRLLAEGIAISPRARAQLSGREDRPLTLSDYASTSGISMRLGDDVWVNAPISEHNPNFVAASPHSLDVSDEGYCVRSGDLEVRALPLPVPEYYKGSNRWGESYTEYAYTHTDRVRISPIEGCDLRCFFCDMPYEFQYRTKRKEGLVDAVEMALDDPVLPARHVLISGGTPRRSDNDYIKRVYELVLGAFPGVAIDIMMVPIPELLDVGWLSRLGVHELSVNIEMFNFERAREIMPSKASVGLENYLKLIEECVGQLGVGRVRSLILVGLEDLEDTVAGVNALAERGCEPVLSPFRPDPKTPLADRKPPSVDFMREVYLRCTEAVTKHSVKLGPKCIPCMHNTLTFPDGSDYYGAHHETWTADPGGVPRTPAPGDSIE